MTVSGAFLVTVPKNVLAPGYLGTRRALQDVYGARESLDLRSNGREASSSNHRKKATSIIPTDGKQATFCCTQSKECHPDVGRDTAD